MSEFAGIEDALPTLKSKNRYPPDESSFISAVNPLGEPLALTLNGVIISGLTIKSNCIPEIALLGLLIITGTSMSEEYPGYSTLPNVTDNWAERTP